METRLIVAYMLMALMALFAVGGIIALRRRGKKNERRDRGERW